VKCEAAAAILASEGPALVSVGRQHARSSCDFAQHVVCHISSRSKVLCRRGQNVTNFGKDEGCDKKRNKLKKKNVCESVILEM